MKKILLLSSIVLVSACSPKLRKAELISGKSLSQYHAFGKNFMISSQGRATTEAAKFIYSKGGNIYDAFVAASFAISVERPHSTGIGGGGFLVSRNSSSKKIDVYDFREMAPAKAHSKMYLDSDGKQLKDKSLTGALAAGTPGLVAGLWEIHQQHGKLAWATTLRPAIDLAEKGMKVYPALAKAMEAEKDRLCRFPSSKKIFLKANCIPFKAGEILYQKDLARTLKIIARFGRDGFYKGQIAKYIVRSQKKYKGLMSARDLAGYKVKKRDPVIGTYRGKKIISMPPPSSGGAHIVQILNILENFNLSSNPQDVQNIHYTSAAMQMAFADRAEYMGDADFAKVPLERIISKDYAKVLASKVSHDKALSSKDFPLPPREFHPESSETTHFTIADIKGNIISSTQTINGWFGSGLVAERTGILFNNEMDDFASHIGGVNLFGAIGGKNNLVEPFKRPLSSMSPSIVLDENDKPILALGTPSGTRILTCTMQTILNVLEYDMDLWDAVSVTRYHHQWSPDSIRIGPPYFAKETENRLKSMGYKTTHKPLGCKIQAVRFHQDKLEGVSDPREEGMSIGL